MDYKEMIEPQVEVVYENNEKHVFNTASMSLQDLVDEMTNNPQKLGGGTPETMLQCHDWSTKGNAPFHLCCEVEEEAG